MTNLCKAPGCTKPDPGNRKGYCYAHYLRNWRHGDASAGGISRGQARQFIIDNVSYAGDDCLIWPFYRAPSGYGDVNFYEIPGQAHRVMCTLAHGPAPCPDDEAAHECGKGAKGCINPRHLKWKSTLENSRDKARHGTQPWGDMIHFAKLTLEQARHIKYCDENNSFLAKKFNVSVATINHIRSGRTWKGI